MTQKPLHTLEMPVVTPAENDVTKTRNCLRCNTAFVSEGFGERICKRCKGQKAWRNAAPSGSRR
ncbi:hypothetical protein [Pararhodobacter zhoushanensis]|uniref:hypothetical protein n=1 Tax=Pararhodobacter zhoushanensis TaxID=2479545 RepID=UPI000F8CD0A0|nr:hypothetical protein [Pararhodobacter zhoushanensis]